MISKKYSKEQRLAIASDIVEYIRDRASRGEVPGKKTYSKGYADSLDFRIAGKSESKVDMTLSGDMLTELDILGEKSGEILIGYDRSSDQYGKAEGNILGSYGGKANKKNARPFLNLTDKEIRDILKDYPLNNPKLLAKTTEDRLTSDSVLEEFEAISEYMEED